MLVLFFLHVGRGSTKLPLQGVRGATLFLAVWKGVFMAPGVDALRCLETGRWPQTVKRFRCSARVTAAAGFVPA